MIKNNMTTAEGKIENRLLCQIIPKMKESIWKIIIRERKGKNKDGNNFNCTGDYMEGNGRAVCSSGTDLVLHLDDGKDWAEKSVGRTRGL